ncbi:DICT sensory domain-containing protein [Anabaena sp. UHCC 0204]|uniref:DICT sensory domain-containing protein n=1 Tax=Anabaena sp. UHCC 0204 TaxID=2590009 RepID=UPI0014486C99|nr:DICT sensory domain-containing protein [Anabaena sp. UHCC 0204]MTJ07544.1 ATPase [Anabaena sp. UHCC 0204]
MKYSLVDDLSVYNLTLNVSKSTTPIFFTPVTLLSIIRAKIDLLIEQQIAATILVKLPPGKLWYSEIERYQKCEHLSKNIYNYQTNKQEFSDLYINIELLADNQLKNEYFLLILSPEFWSLMVAARQIPENQSREKIKSQKKSPLLTINTFECEIIQEVVNEIKRVNPPDVPPIFTDFICPYPPQVRLINQLWIKQIQRQEEINQQTINKQIIKVRQNHQNIDNKEYLQDEYLINICQELRTPLTHIKTALSLLNSPQIKPPQRQRYLQMLNQECDRQSSLITGLLHLLELERNLAETKLEAVNLSDIIPGVVSTYQSLAQEKGIMISSTIPNDIPSVYCVNGGLREIMINLLHNSLKFTPTGGQVLVSAKLQGDYILLEIRDTGMGIPENEIPKIFDRFYRVRTGISEDFNGAGLGLTIVKQLLRHSRGSISVKSKLYAGSNFIIKLAIVNPKTE